MKKRRDSHAALDGARRILPGESRLFGVVITLFECPIQKLVEDHGFAHHLFSRGRISIPKEVYLPQLNWIHSNRGRDLVHVPLDREDGLRSPESTKCTEGYSVCGECTRAHPDVG